MNDRDFYDKWVKDNKECLRGMFYILQHHGIKAFTFGRFMKYVYHNTNIIKPVDDNVKLE